MCFTKSRVELTQCFSHDWKKGNPSFFLAETERSGHVCPLKTQKRAELQSEAQTHMMFKKPELKLVLCCGTKCELHHSRVGQS